MRATNLTWWERLATRLPFGRRTRLKSIRCVADGCAGATLPTLGVFIDFDNINGTAISLVLEHLRPHWNMILRRAYGVGLAKNKTLLHEHGILPVEVVPNAPRKNSSDIALLTDVAFAACSNTINAFCIVSSDSDYTHLALMLREQGKPLVVIGRSTTPRALRSACAEFIDLDTLTSRASALAFETPNLLGLGAAPGMESGLGQPQSTSLSYLSRDRPIVRRQFEKRVDPLELVSIIGELIGHRGSTNLKAIQARCAHRYTDFSPRMCGATRWTNLLQSLAVFSVEPMRDKAGRIHDYAVGFLDQ